jgi:MATE family, multidrug efflux pump
MNPAPPHSQPLGHEIRRLVELSIPLVLVQTGLMLMGVVDTAMAGEYSAKALASVGLGHAYASGVAIAISGILYALDPLVAQTFGAKDHGLLREHVERGVLLSLLLSLPTIALLFGAQSVFEFLRQDPEVAEGAVLYVHRLAISMPAYLLFTTLRQTYQATDRPRAILAAIVLANVFNVAANYALVFGNWGLPGLGVEGSALATSLSRWLLVLVFLIVGRGHREVVGHAVSSARHRPRAYGQIMRIGVPIAIQVSLEMWVFTAVTLFAGKAGKDALAGHIIALNLASLAFMIPLGIGMAAAARVGQAVGAGDGALARRRVRLVLSGGGVLQVLLAAIFLIAPRPLAEFYTDDPAVLDISASLIRIAGVFQLFDGIQVIAAGILRGVADTRVPAFLALVGYWILGLPAGHLIATRGSEIEVAGYWWGLCIGLGAVSLFLVLRITRIFRGPLQRFA